jgi:hypothetical protein
MSEMDRGLHRVTGADLGKRAGERVNPEYVSQRTTAQADHLVVEPDGFDFEMRVRHEERRRKERERKRRYRAQLRQEAEQRRMHNPRDVDYQALLMALPALRTLSLYQRRALDLLIAVHARHRGTRTEFPVTYDDFAAAGVSRRRISTSLAALVKAGALEVVRRGRGGRGDRQSNIYRLPFIDGKRDIRSVTYSTENCPTARDVRSVTPRDSFSVSGTGENSANSTIDVTVSVSKTAPFNTTIAIEGSFGANDQQSVTHSPRQEKPSSPPREEILPPVFCNGGAPTSDAARKQEPPLRQVAGQRGPVPSQPDERMAQAAVEAGWDELRMTKEFAAFREWNMGKGNTWVDWCVPWRTWIERAMERERRQTAPNRATAMRLGLLQHAAHRARQTGSLCS